LLRNYKETDLAIKVVSTNLSKLGNRLIDFVEEAVRPAAVRLFRECGIDVHEVQQNIIVTRGGERCTEPEPEQPPSYYRNARGRKFRAGFVGNE